MTRSTIFASVARSVHSNIVELERTSWEEMARSLRQAGRTFALLLGAAAAVSLVVGGIGIMNIMLVSVTERTREIGLRMATGARASDVALQFLIEAVTLSVIGGLVGLALGLLASKIVGRSLDWPTRIPIGAIIMAIGIAALVGLVFGSYPARRASRLDPIDALRTE